MKRDSQEAGQTLIVFALVLALFFLGMITLVSDAGALYVAYNRLDGAALLAAQSAGSAIDTEAFYTGSIRLDVAEARRRCQESLATSHVPGTCSVERGGAVVADASDTVRLPVSLPGVTARIHAARSAQPAFGGSTATGRGPA
jgi:hypothetical protein